MPEIIAEPPENFLTGQFLTTMPAPKRPGGGLVVAAGATAAGWFTYGPLSTLLDIKAGHVDEIATRGVGTATATLRGSGMGLLKQRHAHYA